MDFYPLFFAWSKQMQLTSGTRSDGSLITFANADGYNNRHKPTWWKRPPPCSSLHIQVTTSRGDMPEALPGPRCGVSGNLASSCKGCECAWWVLLLAEEGLRKTRWGATRPRMDRLYRRGSLSLRILPSITRAVGLPRSCCFEDPHARAFGPWEFGAYSRMLLKQGFCWWTLDLNLQVLWFWVCIYLFIFMRNRHQFEL